MTSTCQAFCLFGGYLISFLFQSFAASLPQLPPGAADQPITFAVFGDNRGGEDGEQPAAFREILQAISASTATFILHTGDMIYGNTEDQARARDQWRIYRQHLSSLKQPIVHSPGNHDIWDAPSAKLYSEVIGQTYYSFDHGSARFISLDTETQAGRVGSDQFAWLASQLETAESKNIFLFFHRPLFPSGASVGSSLDKYPAERDQLHQLFVKHRPKIKAFFQGHEDLYHFETRDGIPYYITGGGGANLYVPPEIGGFHHWLLVRLADDRLTVELKRVGALPPPLQPARIVKAGELLESWEQGLFWYPWDYTVNANVTSTRASAGQRALQLNYDFAQNPWPVLSLPLRTPIDLRATRTISIDVFAPDDLKEDLLLTPGLETKTQHQAAPVKLKPGWSTVHCNLDDTWVPRAELSSVRNIGWTLTSSNPSIGSLVFDNFRIKSSDSNGASQVLSDSWESPLFWRAIDESVSAERTSKSVREGKSALQLHLDFKQCEQPMVLARLNPPWNLTSVDTLVLDAFVPEQFSNTVEIRLALRAQETTHFSPTMALSKGWNTIRANLSQDWLPKEVRSSAEQIEWAFSSKDKTLSGSVALDNLRAGP
jgi:hypothetical protein